MSAVASPARVVLAGVHGHGHWHLRNLARLETQGRVRLVGVCDPQPLEGALAEQLQGVPHDDTLAEALERRAPDVVVLCTPIHTHVDLATAAMTAGAHVLLEKPPAPTRAGHLALRDAAEAAGVACQIGFQSFGSNAVEAARQLVAGGAIGELRGIGVAGAWVRGAAYYQRAPWAGRRVLDGRDVVDGALTNPFAHATATALRIDGSDGADGGFASLDLALFHANDIEADDTSSLTAVTTRGTPLAVAVTLCSPAHHEPYVLVHGNHGSVQVFYKTHRLRTVVDGIERESQHDEVDLLDNLLDHLADDAVELLAPVERTLGFAEVIDGVRLADPPRAIPAPYVQWVEDEAGPRVVVTGIDAAVERCARELTSFADLGLPWADLPATAARKSLL
ncbi:Gfo/Idh/MocA family protein [Egicoccus sp. AB-alg6-2]|uniref:Gfo/Idh/MocA family protein n=1 Tax=Egicoccus sp. AB-alg6-2 TaxID=3242692 RepID=UPI00359DC1D7